MDMTYVGIALIIVAIAFCVLVVTLIPTILAVRRTADSVSALHDVVQKELRPTLAELAAVLAEIRTISSGIAEHTGDVKRFMSALGETGASLHTINRTVGVATGVLNATSVWITGARMAGKYVLERYLKKRGGN
jgi:uncharacterized protein YoxC